MTARAWVVPALALGAVASCGPAASSLADSTHLAVATGESRVDRTRWSVSASGIGTVRVGMSLETVASVLGVPASGFAPGSRACASIRLETLPPGAALVVVRDTVVRIDVDSAGVRTEEGVGVGDSEVGLLVLYAGAIRVQAHGTTAHTLFVSNQPESPYNLVFETDGSRVLRYRAGRRAETQGSGTCGERPLRAS